MPVVIALLRAVNVAGGRMVSMTGLREMLAGLGLDNPRTLLQSGNAVFGSAESPARLEAALEKATLEQFGIVAEFFVRTAREWHGAMEANPFVQEAREDPGHLLLMPLKGAPSATQVAALRASIQGRERIAVDGRRAYLVYPDGIGRSKLTNALIEAKLGTRGTGRNWNTVRKLGTLVGAA